MQKTYKNYFSVNDNGELVLATLQTTVVKTESKTGWRLVCG